MLWFLFRVIEPGAPPATSTSKRLIQIQAPHTRAALEEAMEWCGEYGDPVFYAKDINQFQGDIETVTPTEEPCEFGQVYPWLSPH